MYSACDYIERMRDPEYNPPLKAVMGVCPYCGDPVLFGEDFYDFDTGPLYHCSCVDDEMDTEEVLKLLGIKHQREEM